ncbi:hypothetical protein [Klebsiella oxytoca]|uniref:hypothetical protein n=1 Tax=Klebsiella oxytoca TaxID=571 RepID=UPI000D7524A3|nr:hypothetical protein [Klebsiella oxytoca]
MKPSRRSLNTVPGCIGTANEHFAFYISYNINTRRIRAEHKIMTILNDLQMIIIFKLLACWLRSLAACGNGNIHRCPHYAHHFIHHQRNSV